MHTLPRNSAGHTLFLFFASFRRSKSALCHLLCEATCSLRTEKQLGNNVTSVDEYWKIVTAQQLGDRICTSYTMFWGSCTFHVSNVIVELRKRIQVIIYTSFLCWKSNFKNPRFGFQQASKRLKRIKTRPAASWFQMFLAFGNLMKPSHLFLQYYINLFRRSSKFPACIQTWAWVHYKLDARVSVGFGSPYQGKG